MRQQGSNVLDERCIVKPIISLLRFRAVRKLLSHIAKTIY